jgi:hypothetical protein
MRRDLTLAMMIALAQSLAFAEDFGAPIACTLRGMPDARIVYIPDTPELSLRWTVISHDGTRKETPEPIVDARHASGGNIDFSTCTFDRKYEPQSHSRSANYHFNYTCGTEARGEFSYPSGSSGTLWTELRLSGGFIDRKEYVITQCW